MQISRDLMALNMLKRNNDEVRINSLHLTLKSPRLFRAGELFDILKIKYYRDWRFWLDVIAF
jgi:hypothetical protein